MRVKMVRRCRIGGAPSRCASGRKWAHSIGTNVRDRQNDVSIANVTASASGQKSCPFSPGISATGLSTRMVVEVATMTGTITSRAPSMAARMRDLPMP